MPAPPVPSAAMVPEEPDDESLTPEKIAKLRRYKRLYLASQDDKVKPNAKKQKTQDKHLSIQKLGRGLRKNVSLFDGIWDIIQLSDEYEVRMLEEKEDEELFPGLNEEEIATKKREQKRGHTAMKELQRIVPKIQERIDSLEAEESQLVISMLEKGGNDARSDDTSRLKEKVAKWLNKLMSPPPDPQLDPDDRFLLCPVEYDWGDADVRKNLRNWEDDYDINSSFFCRCFYRDFAGDPSDLQKGFLQSGLLVKTYQYIFTTPSSARSTPIYDPEPPTQDENVDPQGQRSTMSRKPKPACDDTKAATRRSVASILQMDHVTPRSIAYVACQLHTSLSSSPCWKEVYQGFSYIKLYYFIIDFFEDAGGPAAQKCVKKLLRWWNKLIFSNAPSSGPPNHTALSSYNSLKAQRDAEEKIAATNKSASAC